jgi:hypothetical protein
MNALARAGETVELEVEPLEAVRGSRHRLRSLSRGRPTSRHILQDVADLVVGNPGSS